MGTLEDLLTKVIEPTPDAREVWRLKVEKLLEQIAEKVGRFPIKGPPVVMWPGPQSFDQASPEIVDMQHYNAIHVDVIVNGTTPSATIAIQGAPFAGGIFQTLEDTDASRAAVAANTNYDLPVGAAFVRVNLSSVTGTFGAGLGYTITITPYVA